MRQQFEQTLSSLFPANPNGLTPKETKALASLKTNFLSTALTAILKFSQDGQDKDTLEFIAKELLTSQPLSYFLENNFNTPSIYFNITIFKPYLEAQTENELSLILKNINHPVIQKEVADALTTKSKIIPLLPFFDKIAQAFEDIEKTPADIKRHHWSEYQNTLKELVRVGELSKITALYREAKKSSYKESPQYNSVEVEKIEEKLKVFEKSYVQFFSQPDHWAYIGDFYHHTALRASYGFSSTTVYRLIEKSDKQALSHAISTSPAKETIKHRFLSQLYFTHKSSLHNNISITPNQSAQHFYSVCSMYMKDNTLDKVLFITDKIGIPYIFEAFLGAKQYKDNSNFFEGKTTALLALQALDAYLVSQAPKYQKNSAKLRAELDKNILLEFVPEAIIVENTSLKHNTTFKI